MSTLQPGDQWGNVGAPPRSRRPLYRRDVQAWRFPRGVRLGSFATSTWLSVLAGAALDGAVLDGAALGVSVAKKSISARLMSSAGSIGGDFTISGPCAAGT